MLFGTVMTMTAATSPDAATTPQAQVLALVDAANAARLAFDQVALARTLAPDYVEVSPVGDVDPRDRVLGFYAPDRRRPAPAIVTGERGVRVHGDVALVTERQAIGTLAVRVLYVARRTDSRWQLVSAQYTPIRPA